MGECITVPCGLRWAGDSGIIGSSTLDMAPEVPCSHDNQIPARFLRQRSFAAAHTGWSNDLAFWPVPSRWLPGFDADHWNGQRELAAPGGDRMEVPLAQRGIDNVRIIEQDAATAPKLANRASQPPGAFGTRSG